MTSSIFLPRMSRAWPEPSTHLMESTMFVFPEPLGPTMAVTPPSNRISVCRAKVLKPSNCREVRNKLPGRLADVPMWLKVCQQPPNRAFEGLVSAHSLTGWAGSSDPSHDDPTDVNRTTRGAQAPSSAGSAVLASNRSVAPRARRSALRSDRGHPTEIEPDLASRGDCA